MQTKEKLFPIAKTLVKVFYILLSVGIVLLVAYFFGFFLLRDPLVGSDSTNSLTFIVWLERYFPKIPFWYPLQGAGSSFVTGYPILYHFLVVLVHRLTSISLTEAMSLLNFLVIPLGGLGAYLFVLTRFRNLPAALLAGVFYLLSPMLYVWIYGAGFLAQTFSFIFVAPSFLFFDTYLERKLANKNGWLSRVALLGTILSLSLAMLAHPATAIGILVTLGFYSVLYPAFVFRKEKVRVVFAGIKTYAKTIILFFLAIAWWFVPFYHYTGLAGRGINSLLVDPKTLPPIELLPTLGVFSNNGYPYPDFSIVIPVVILALIGLVLGYFYSRKTFVLGLLVLFNLFITGSFALNFFFNHLSPTLGAVFSLRYGVGLSLFLTPVVAALGVYYLVKLFLLPLQQFLKKDGLGFVKEGLLLLLVPVVAAVVLILFNGKATTYKDKNFLYYGPSISGINLNYPFLRTPQRQIKNLCTGENNQPLECSYPEITSRVDATYFLMLCDALQQRSGKRCLTFPSHASPEKVRQSIDLQMQQFISSCESKEGKTVLEKDLCLARIKDNGQKLALKNWPPFALDGPSVSQINNDIADKELDKLERVDLSPSTGGLLTFNIKHNTTLVNAYTGQLILNKPMLGVFQHTFYTKDDQPVDFNNLASWYGLDALFVNPATDPIEKFDKAGWTTRYLGGIQKRIPLESSGLANLSANPLVLVIGNQDKGAYEHVFRSALAGVFPYQDAWVVPGQANIDAYSLNDLRRYSWVVLHGYSYSNKSRAWKLITDYINDGGKVFVETGWQFVDKDWGKGPNQSGSFVKINTPEPFPVAKTTWGDVGEDWDHLVFSDQEAEQQKKQFSPLTSSGKPWGVSVGEKSSLRDNSQVLISTADKVIMASRKIGQGEIIWSGLDIFSHALANKNQDELNFLKGVFDLNSGTETKVSYLRENPDRVVFQIPQTEGKNYLLWKEYYYPGWQANFVGEGKTEHLKILQAGPGFSLIALPEGKSGKVVLAFHRPLIYTLAKIVSVVALIFLLVNLFFPKILGRISGKFPINFFGIFPKIKFTPEEEG